MQLLTIVVLFKTLKMRVYQKHPNERICDKFATVLPANVRDEIIFETRWTPDISWSFFFNRVEVNRSFHVETSSGLSFNLSTLPRKIGISSGLRATETSLTLFEILVEVWNMCIHKPKAFYYGCGDTVVTNYYAISRTIWYFSDLADLDKIEFGQRPTDIYKNLL